MENREQWWRGGHNDGKIGIRPLNVCNYYIMNNFLKSLFQLKNNIYIIATIVCNLPQKYFLLTPTLNLVLAPIYALQRSLKASFIE